MDKNIIIRKILFTILGIMLGALVGFFVAWPVWWIAGWIMPLIRPTLAFIYEGDPPLWLHGSWALFLGLIGGTVGYSLQSP